MKKTQKKYKVIIEKTGTGYSAYLDKYPVFTTGKNIEKLSFNILEALNLYLESIEEYADMSNIALYFDFRLFFKEYKVLNIKFLAKRIGMNPSLFSQYIQGKKEISARQLNKITKGIHELGSELKDLNLVVN